MDENKQEAAHEEVQKIGEVFSNCSMTSRKTVALSALIVWCLTLGFISGPVRWELAHTYQHLIEGFSDTLPLLTSVVTLPILGLSPFSLTGLAVIVFFWGFTWLGAITLLRLVWRAKTPDQLLETLVYGGLFYGTGMFLLATLVSFGIFLPFALL